MTELQIKVPEMPRITSNFDLIKAEVEKMVARYDGLVYEDIGQAKRDKAALNKLKTALNKARIETGKQYNAPFEEFKGQVDSLIGTITSAVSGINQQISAAESDRKKAKRETIIRLFAGMDFPPEVTLEQLWNEKWLNASVSEKAVRDDLETRRISICSALTAIDSMGSFEAETRQRYLETLDLAAAMSYHSQLVEMERRVKERQEREAREKAEREAREAAEKAAQKAAGETEAAQKAETPPEPELPDLPEPPEDIVIEVDPDAPLTLPIWDLPGYNPLPEPEPDCTLRWYEIRLLVTEEELAAVENYIASLGAEYKVWTEQEGENG